MDKYLEQPSGIAPDIQRLRITNWIFLVIQFLFLILLIIITVKYMRKYNSFRDKYTLCTLLALIVSLMADCITIYDAYPWADFDMNDFISFLSLQISKVFYLVSVVLYASRWIFMVI
jgi:heme/copper-type cytochrome/quinol oxidase subunit 2